MFEAVFCAETEIGQTIPNALSSFLIQLLGNLPSLIIKISWEILLINGDG